MFRFSSSLLGLVFLSALLFSSCSEEKEHSSVDPVNWEKRTLKNSIADSIETGTTYLSVYSQIYSRSEHSTHDLTVTVSMRNTSVTDSVYVLKADYYNTHGKLIRTYFKQPIFLLPMETVEIVIDEEDQEGGTGANFIFEWKSPNENNEPLFEAVMISTSNSQGLSFTTQGKRIK